MERTHTGTMGKELQPEGRTRVGVVHEERQPMGGTTCWSRERMREVFPPRRKEQQKQHAMNWLEAPFPISLCC